MFSSISKRPWIALAAVIAAAALAVAYSQIMTRSQAILEARHAGLPSTLVAATDPEAVARGKRLVQVTACAGCHGRDLAGGPLNVYGTAFETGNLTREPRRLTDAELDRAIRQGIRPDGTSEIAMPAQAYARFTDDEMAAVIGYLRTLPPKGGPAPRATPDLLMRAALLTGTLKMAVAQVAAGRLPLDAGPRVAAGRHLTAIACGRCHGTDLGGIGDAGPDLTVRGYYSRAKFHALISKGEAIGEGNMQLMTKTAEDNFSHFTDPEVDALYDYLDARDGVLVAKAKAK